MTTTTAPRARTRRDAFDVGKVRVRQRGPEPTEQMISSAREAYEANQRKNEGNRVEGKAKKDLMARMAQAQVPIKEFSFMVSGKTVNVKVADKEGSAISVEKLVKKVGVDEALRVLGTSVGAVQDAFGKNIAAACTVVTTTPDHLTIKERK